jgi:hypothetical protein
LGAIVSGMPFLLTQNRDDLLLASCSPDKALHSMQVFCFCSRSALGSRHEHLTAPIFSPSGTLVRTICASPCASFRSAFTVIALRAALTCRPLRQTIRQALIDTMVANPLRRGTSFEANANQIIMPSPNSGLHHRGITEHLPLPKHLAALADNANGDCIE